MDIKDIKIGEMYNVLMQIHDYVDGIIFCSTVIDIDTKDGVQCGEECEICHDEISAFSPISTAPKYAPCRKFRKGDKVRVVDEKNDRTPPCCGDIEAGEFYTVSADEDDGDVMLAVNGKYDCIEWYWLELVSPVEATYSIFEDERMGCWVIAKDGLTYAYYPFRSCVSDNIVHTKEEARERAEAECARLNAEYRKEQK